MPSNRTSLPAVGPLSTPAFVEKQAKRNAAVVSGNAERLRYLEDRGLLTDEDTRWRVSRKKKKAAEIAAQPKPGERHLLFYGRISSPNALKGSGDRRQGGNAVGICLRHQLGDPAKIHSFFDYGVSGTKLNRPELDRLIEFIMANWGCDLMVEDIDRIARDSKVLLIIGGQLMKGGVRIWDINGEVSAEQFMERGIRAAADWKKITGRGNIDRRENIRAGALNAPASFGYRKPKKGKLVVDAKAAPLLKKIYQLYLGGRTYSYIARWLEDRRVTNRKGGRWSTGRVKDTLQHKVNIGVVETQFEDGEKVRHFFPELQIIDDDTFHAAIRKIADEERPKEQKSAGLSISRRNPYVLGGKVICPACGSLMRILPAKDPTKLQLVCRAYLQHACDNGERFPYRMIEGKILTALLEILTPEFDSIYLAKAKEEHEAKHGDAEGRREALRAEIVALARKIKLSYDDPDEEEDTFQEILKGRRAALKEKEAALAGIKSDHFYGFAASALSSLAEEIKGLIARSPFVAQDEDELQLAKALSKIIGGVVASRLEDGRVGVEFDLDFSSDLGMKPGTLVISRSAAFEWKAQRRFRPQDLYDETQRERLMLDEAEVARLRGIPGLDDLLSDFDEDTIRNALNAIAVGMQSNCGLHQAAQAIGFDRSSNVKRAITKIREAPFVLCIIDVVVELRGDLPGEGRLARRPRPRRRLRAKYLAEGHLVMTLRQTQLGAPDEPLSDEEWAVARNAIIAQMGPMPGGRIAQLRNHVRSHLDSLFRSLREDVLTYRIIGVNGARVFLNALRQMEKNGMLGIAVKALKDHQDARHG